MRCKVLNQFTPQLDSKAAKVAKRYGMTFAEAKQIILSGVLFGIAMAALTNSQGK